MAKHAQYWRVGAVKDVPLAFSPNDFAAFLIADWLPTLPGISPMSLMGWPAYIYDRCTVGTDDYLALKADAGLAERQWKGVLSWMVGVASCRRVLREEGYQWVAPCSAFYSNAKQPVVLSRWPSAYPPTVLTVDKPAGSKVRLRPDYVAIRILPGPTVSVEWALVEAKGTTAALQNALTCPKPWYDQVRNAELRNRGSVFAVNRHLVVAARTKGDAKRPKTRRLQIRAWNATSDAQQEFGLCAVELVAAAVYGLCRNLLLRKNAAAIALAARGRLVGQQLDVEWKRSNAAADRELTERARISPLTELAGAPRGLVELDAAWGWASVDLSAPLIRLIRTLRSREINEQIVTSVRREVREVDAWHHNAAERYKSEPAAAVQREGFVVRFSQNGGSSSDRSVEQ